MHQQTDAYLVTQTQSYQCPHFLHIPHSLKCYSPCGASPQGANCVEAGNGLGGSVAWHTGAHCCQSSECSLWRPAVWPALVCTAQGSPRRWAMVVAAGLHSKTLLHGEGGSRCQCHILPGSSLTPVHECFLQGRGLSLLHHCKALLHSLAPLRCLRVWCWASSLKCPSGMLDHRKVDC